MGTDHAAAGGHKHARHATSRTVGQPSRARARLREAMSTSLDRAPADLLAGGTASRRGGTGLLDDGFGSSATGEKVRDRDRRPVDALACCGARGGLTGCVCTVRCRQMEDLVKQALRLMRGNLSAEILADQNCVFLGSVDGQGRPDGQGVAANRSVQREERNEYAGDFQGGARHGIGAVKFGDGTTYQGEWVMDHPKGYGVENYPDGGVYKGRFWNDARHGLGAYYFANGQRYFGRWSTGVRHGEGVEMGKSGEKFFSMFEM